MKNIVSKNNLKLILCVFLSLVLAIGLCACGSGNAGGDENTEGSDAGSETYEFTDSCNRTVEIPEEITRIAPSGALAQMVLMTIAPEKLVGLSATPSEEQYPYFPEEMIKLPTFGQFYGSKANLNMESLIAADPQVIIDIGDMKAGHAGDMRKIQEQTGIPTIFVKAEMNDFPEAYRTLGKILGKEEKGEELAAYIEDVLALAKKNREKLTEEDMLTVMYGTGSTGLDVNAKDSVQADVIPIVGAENAIVTEDVTNKGGGTLVNLEEVYTVDPDVIILNAGGPYDRIAAGGSEWDELKAVKEGKVYEVPNVPYCWMSSPPSVNRVIGVLWLGNLLYPELYDYDMVSKAQEFYKLFWNYDLSEEEAQELLANSTLKDQ